MTGEVICDVGQEITEDLANRDPGGGHRAGEDPLGAHLRDPPRRVRAVLRPQPGHRRLGRDRRGGGRHRRAVDRRARHPAHDADLPLRRYREPRLRAVEARGQEPRHRAFINVSTVESQARRPGGDQPQRQAGAGRRRRAARRSATRSPTARACYVHEGERGRARTRARGMGPVHLGHPLGDRRHGRVPRHRRGRERPRGDRQGHRPRRSASSSRRRRTRSGSPAIVVKGRSRRAALPAAVGLAPGGAGRPGGGRRRDAGQDPARDHQDQGHHRRSAARRRAVRGAHAARSRRSSPRSTAPSVSATSLKGMRRGHRRERRGRDARVPGPALHPRQRAGRASGSAPAMP